MTIVHVISSTLIALSVVVSVTVLGLQGTLDAGAVTGILGPIGGIAGAAFGIKVGSDIANNSAAAARHE